MKEVQEKPEVKGVSRRSILKGAVALGAMTVAAAWP